MFSKTSVSSYLIPQWFKKSTSSTTNVNNTVVNNEFDSKSSPKNIIIQNHDNKLINISMKDYKDSESAQNEDNVDEFIDIQTKQLSYAEVAALAKNKIQTSHPQAKKIVAPRDIVKPNQHTDESANVVDISKQTATDSNYDLFKNDAEYAKSKSFKTKQFESVQKKKQKNKQMKDRKSS